MEISICYKVPPSTYVHKQICTRCEQRLQKIPNHWDSISPRQYIAIMGVLNSGADFHNQQLQIVYILLNQPWDHEMQYYLKHFITTDQIWLFTQITDFIFNTETLLTKNHLPKIRIAGRNYYGPENLMQNSSFSQFMDIDHTMMFSEAKELDKLIKIAAIMYLPKGEEYDSIISQKRQRLFATLNEKQLYAIGFFFSSVKLQLANQFQHLFIKSETENSKGNWAEPLFALSQDPVRLTQNSKERAITVLFHMDQTIKRQKEQQAAQKHG